MLKSSTHSHVSTKNRKSSSFEVKKSFKIKVLLETDLTFAEAIFLVEEEFPAVQANSYCRCHRLWC